MQAELELLLDPQGEAVVVLRLVDEPVPVFVVVHLHALCVDPALARPHVQDEVLRGPLEVPVPACILECLNLGVNLLLLRRHRCGGGRTALKSPS